MRHLIQTYKGRERNTTQLPSWCFDDKCDEYDPLFTHPVFSPYDLELFIDNTPAEFRKRNVFCENNHLEYRGFGSC